jgi:hypothetical protein
VQRRFQFALIIFMALALNACGGGGGGGHHVSATTPAAPSGPNVVNVHVNGGPLPYPNDSINVAYTTVTICEPGSANCVTLDNIAIDTGSTGLRVLGSAVASLNLAATTNVNATPLLECVRFLDTSHVWGPIKTADVKIGDEVASSIPIQLIGNPSGIIEPDECNDGDTTSNLDTQIKLRANGILGIGLFEQDCGNCATPSFDSSIHWPYFTCNGGGCTRSGALPSSQVSNPIAAFPADNNGSILQFPAVAASGVTGVDGWLIFGIGTQNNNSLGAATVIAVDYQGEFQTKFQGQIIDGSFIDSGSNTLSFPNITTPPIAICPTATDFYCPDQLLTLTALVDINNAGSNVSFNVFNAESLPVSFHAFSGLAGENQYSGGFDWGLPFFFGRKVYTALETNPEGPYIAF